MSTLPAAGAPAPPFSLADAAGQRLEFGGASPHPATLLFFIKHDCATCGLTAPAVERVARALSPSGLAVVAVSQSSAADTAAFAERHGLSFTVVLDDELDASAEYGFDAVPVLVLAGPDAVVLATMEGWSRPEFQALAALAAERCGTSVPAFEPEGEPFRNSGRDARRASTIPMSRGGSPCGAGRNGWPRGGSACRPPATVTNSTSSSTAG